MGITAVWGPPQSGKTTTAIDLAFALSRSGQSVLLISPEVYSELSVRLNVQIKREKSLMTAYKNKDSLKQIVHTADDLLYVLAVPYDNDAFGEELPEDVARSILTQARNLFNEVIIDCPSHAGSVLAAWALSDCDQVLMISGSNGSSVLWHKAYRKALDAVERKALHICTEVSAAFDYHTLLTMLGITPEVWIPYFPNADMVLSMKRTLYQSNGKIGRAYTKAFDSICALLSRKEEDAT